MKNRILSIASIVAVSAIAAAIFSIIYFSLPYPGNSGNRTTSSTVKYVTSEIAADGAVTAQEQTKLNFQTSGKLVSLPFKEGDRVLTGQLIAQLDTYQLQKQLNVALNNYRSARDTFDQTKDNIQNNVLKAQQTYPYDYYSRAGLGDSKENAVNDAIKRIADQSQASLDNSVVNVELANYAFQFSRLTSPIDGIITHEDVTVSGVNITPATSFMIANPDTMIFRANVPVENIYYVSLGSSAEIVVDGLSKRFNGTVSRIYPSKITLPGGQSVYQVDIASDDMKNVARLDQPGRAMISTNAENVALIPAWTVLSGKLVWIDNNGKPELRKVKTGKTHDNQVEIIDGLDRNDKVIIDPMSVASFKYKAL